eukprot:4199248-Amphidinium_carterae.1
MECCATVMNRWYELSKKSSMGFAFVYHDEAQSVRRMREAIYFVVARGLYASCPPTEYKTL